MGGIGIFQLLFLFVFWVLPIILVIKSKRAYGTNKAIWLLATLLFNWIGYLLFRMVFTEKPGSGENQNHQV